MKIIIVAARSKNNVIGNNNSLPWVLKDDLKHFSKLTRNKYLVMGLTTYRSIVNLLGNPLDERVSLVLSDEEVTDEYENTIFFSSIEDLKRYYEKNKIGEVYVVGGGIVYKQFIKSADKLIITEVDCVIEGDTKFPKIDLDKLELLDSVSYSKSEYNQYNFKINIYVKKD